MLRLRPQGKWCVRRACVCLSLCVSPVQDDTFMNTIRAALRGQEVEGKTKKSKKERRKEKKAEAEAGGDT